jgi:hypothetical protein
MSDQNELPERWTVWQQRVKVREFGESSKSLELIDFQTVSDYFV